MAGMLRDLPHVVAAIPQDIESSLHGHGPGPPEARSDYLHGIDFAARVVCSAAAAEPKSVLLVAIPKSQPFFGNAANGPISAAVTGRKLIR